MNLSEREIIAKLQAAEEALLTIVREEEKNNGGNEVSPHLRTALYSLQEALLRLLAR